MNKAKFDLSDRLEDFAASVIIKYDKKPLSYAGDYLAKQLIRSSCSAALNYGEVLEQVLPRIKSISLEFA